MHVSSLVKRFSVADSSFGCFWREGSAFRRCVSFHVVFFVQDNLLTIADGSDTLTGCIYILWAIFQGVSSNSTYECHQFHNLAEWMLSLWKICIQMVLFSPLFSFFLEVTDIYSLLTVLLTDILLKVIRKHIWVFLRSSCLSNLHEMIFFLTLFFHANNHWHILYFTCYLIVILVLPSNSSFDVVN